MNSGAGVSSWYVVTVSPTDSNAALTHAAACACCSTSSGTPCTELKDVISLRSVKILSRCPVTIGRTLAIVSVVITEKCSWVPVCAGPVSHCLSTPFRFKAARSSLWELCAAFCRISARIRGQILRYSSTVLTHTHREPRSPGEVCCDISSQEVNLGPKQAISQHTSLGCESLNW